MALAISDTSPRVQYTATGGQTTFTVPFEFFADGDLTVIKTAASNGADTTLTLTASPSSATQYSVTGAGVSGGGSITLGGGATVNDKYTILRDLSVARASDFPVSGTFPIETLNTELDKIIAMIQQNERDNKFSPQAKSSTSTAFNLTFPELVANKILSVNSSGNALEFSQSITDVSTVAGIASDITTVSGIASAVSTVAGIASNVSTVAGISGNVTTVAGISSNVTTVAGMNSNISSVVSNASNINTVAGNISNVNTAAGVSSAISTVAGISSNVSTVAGVASNVTTVAGISGDVTSVANISSDVQAVEDIASNVTSVAGIASNVTSVANIASDVTSVAGNTSNVSTVATNIANVNTTASNITNVNTFANQYRIGSSDPSSSLDEGDLFYNTTSNELKYYNGSAWVAIVADTDVKVKVSANDTTPGFLNGKLVAGSNISFTEGSDGGNETLTIAATAGASLDDATALAIALG
jgi:hypothetical protein|tara:strand:- start:9 stop:1427 length:1419 start_codon:yes stop_codon:yes gene_type:complete